MSSAREPVGGELITRAAAAFDLGPVLDEPVPVPGGLSNELWRVRTGSGTYAVKRMVLAADRPDFVANVEASFRIERRAEAAGVPLPAPVPDPRTGRALARVGDALVRVHAWVDGVPADATPAEAAALLARVHAAGSPRWADEPTPTPGPVAEAHGARIAELVRRVQRHPARTLVVDSHRDLDRKNTLRRTDGVLVALDWDAAGPVGAAHEAVAFALDRADPHPVALRPEAFRAALDAYRAAAGIDVPAAPWVFAGWVQGTLGWLHHNATERAGTALGDAEAAKARAELEGLADGLDRLLDALG